ncbi:PA3496 family putative envelope integrity protein [uncultured Cocleimonas sp.]|uniref:PA3496 family putative envelope integrity protein n=1 Tax=uncultured Cocleimonas sp. TaxID=1051587 RepID=UPI00262C47EA|nr:hypothetical protein [uncultured Cocleimonas sp.]
MAKVRQDDYYTNDEGSDSYSMWDMDDEIGFEKLSSKKHQKIKYDRNARRRVEDYFEQKALKQKTSDLYDEVYH